MNYKNIYLKKDGKWFLFENPVNRDFHASRVYIGVGVYIGENVYIAPNVYIGEGVYIGENVYIDENVTIDEAVSIAPNACIVSLFYGYYANAYWDVRNEDPVPIVRLGCFTRTLEEWENDFDNNQKEFPIGSGAWKLRKWAYESLKNYLMLTKPESRTKQTDLIKA